MAIDLERLAAALLGGAAKPPRRRRSAAARDPLAALGLGRGRAGGASTVRALATLATVAIEAYGRSQAPSPAPPPPANRRAPPASPPARLPESPPRTGSPWGNTAAVPPAPGAEQAEALLLIRAMIAAAAADGATDAAERGVIAGQLDSAGLSVAERDFVLADFERPLSAEALARQARDPMLAAQVYAAAVAAAGEVSPPERAFLDSLARALRLDAAAKQAIEARLAG